MSRSGFVLAEKLAYLRGYFESQNRKLTGDVGLLSGDAFDYPSPSDDPFDQLKHIIHKNVIRAPSQLQETDVSLDYLLANMWDHSFTIPQCKSLSSDILNGLTYLHSFGITHGKINPKSVIVTKDGVAKIIFAPDCNMASLSDVQAKIMKPAMEGSQLVHYLTPELLQGGASEPRDPSADVWAVACLMCEMVSKPPFSGQTPDQVLHGINRTLAVNEPGAVPLLFWNDFSSGLFAESGVQMLIDMLSLDASKRPTAEVALQYDWFEIEFPPKQAFSLHELQLKRPKEQASYWWLSRNVNL